MKRMAVTRCLGAVLAVASAWSAPAYAQAADAAEGLEAYNRGAFVTALRIWRDLAIAGDVQAQTGMGVLHYNGQGVAIDHGAALQWFSLAAEQGDADAQYNLAVMHGHGLAGPRDQETARYWLEQAALQGHRQAVLDLGQLPPINVATVAPPAKAVDSAQVAEATPLPKADAVAGRYDAGRSAFEAGDFRLARTIWQPLAEAGNARAQTGLGVIYERGHGVDADAAEGAKWFRRAALAGDAAGQTNLALLHVMGRGVAEDDSQAMTWLRRAADQGNATAEYRLGLMHMAGGAAEASPTRAVALYRRAALREHAEAQYNLAVAYDTGVGVERANAVTAARWYRKAADSGLAQAQYNLGVLYLNGVGVAADPVTAHVWFSMAAGFGTGTTAEMATQMLALVGGQMSSIGQTDAALAAFDVARAIVSRTGDEVPSDIVLRTQAMLAWEGYDPGPIDGVAGPRTFSAIDRLKQRLGRGA